MKEGVLGSCRPASIRLSIFANATSRRSGREGARLQRCLGPRMSDTSDAKNRTAALPTLHTTPPPNVRLLMAGAPA